MSPKKRDKKLNEELDALEKRIEQCRILYEMYFSGIEKREPIWHRQEIHRQITRLRRENIKSAVDRFRFRNIQARFNSLTQYWNRVNLQREQGTYYKDRLRLKRRQRTEGDLLNPETQLEKTTSTTSSDEQSEGFYSLQDTPSLELEREVEEVLKFFEADSSGSDGKSSDASRESGASPSNPTLPPDATSPKVSEPSKVSVPPRPEGEPPGPSGLPTKPPKVGEPPANTTGRPRSEGLSSQSDAGVGSGGGGASVPKASSGEGGASIPKVGGGKSAAGRPPVARGGSSRAEEIRRASSSGTEEEKFKKLYRTYLKARKKCGESTDISYDALVRSLKRQIPKLKEKGYKDVDFKVVIKGGKAAILPTAKKERE